MRRWWSKKYKQPPNHPLFDERSLADLQQEMFEDLMHKREELKEDLKDRPGDSDVHGAINEINKILGDAPYVVDDLFDYWERELESGREPDLDMMPGDLVDATH